MSQQPEIAVGILGQDTQALDPIAVIGVDQAIHMAQVGAVDVSTDNAVKASAARILDACLDEPFDVLLGRTALALEEISQRPEPQAQPTTQQVAEAVAAQDHVVQPVAEGLANVSRLDRVVVIVAVGNQQSSSVKQGMHCASADPHSRQHQPAKLPQRAVMVARHVDQFSAPSRECVQRGNHPVLRLAPCCALLRQPPQVQDVADQIQAAAAERRQEVGQFVSVAVPGAQVHV